MRASKGLRGVRMRFADFRVRGSSYVTSGALEDEYSFLEIVKMCWENLMSPAV